LPGGVIVGWPFFVLLLGAAAHCLRFSHSYC